ncbi:MAG: molybdenum cofactor biosynthesis protein MoaE [Ferruginibacter sp.]|nr:molybdenum cofactor biosynthesis protein MoaE [Cytophagales bacterium]
MIVLTDQPIAVADVIAAVQSDRAGAVDVFIGVVRNRSQSKNVVRLEYEAYEAMALRKLRELAAEAKMRWPVEEVAIVHRKGVLQVGEVAVVVAVSTPHRKEAFEACQYLIDTLKEVVPIWKKEVYEDGETWIAAHA